MLSVMAIVFLFLTMLVAPGNAALISQDFYIELTAISLTPEMDHPQHHLYDDHFKTLTDAEVGKRYHGTVTFDDATIPDSGDYTVVHEDWSGSISSAPPFDETQNWSMTWESPVPFGGGFFDPESDLSGPRLTFSDGMLSGIHSQYHADISGGLEDEVFDGDTYLGHGGYWYPVDYHSPVSAIGFFRIEGDLIIPASVPEPGIGFLFGSCALVLAGNLNLRRRRK